VNWLDALTLEPHATVLRRLVAAAESEPAVRFIELCCSVARGAGDELSDLDLGLGLADESWPDALTRVGPILTGLGELVDLLEHRIAEWGDVSHRRFFAQYRNGVQVDLVASPVSRRPGMPVGSVALYDPDGRLQTTFTSSLERATPEDVREWAFLGWIALANLDKYLRRGSPWEALEQLHEARTNLWRLWAVVCAARYPAFGLTSALDLSPPAIPTGLEGTTSTLEAADVRRAGMTLASMLDRISASAADVVGAEVPHAMAGFISNRLAEGG
jgi:predicted nucleotidyltransferase